MGDTLERTPTHPPAPPWVGLKFETICLVRLLFTSVSINSRAAWWWFGNTFRGSGDDFCGSGFLPESEIIEKSWEGEAVLEPCQAYFTDYLSE